MDDDTLSVVVCEVAWSKWPADIVDATKLFEVLGYHTRDELSIGTEAFDKIVSAESAIESARLSGRIKRLSAKDPTSGEVVAYGYRRAEVRQVLGIK